MWYTFLIETWKRIEWLWKVGEKDIYGRWLILAC